MQNNIYFYVYWVSAAQIVVIPVKTEKSKLVHERIVCQKVGRGILAKWTKPERVGWGRVGCGEKNTLISPDKSSTLKGTTI